MPATVRATSIHAAAFELEPLFLIGHYAYKGSRRILGDVMSELLVKMLRVPHNLHQRVFPGLTIRSHTEVQYVCHAAGTEIPSLIYQWSDRPSIGAKDEPRLRQIFKASVSGRTTQLPAFMKALKHRDLEESRADRQSHAEQLHVNSFPGMLRGLHAKLF